MRMLVAARANGLQAIDGPYARIHDTEGLREASASVAALGYDGKWVLHPAQVAVVNEAFTPAAEEYCAGAAILDAYDRATSLDRRGAVMLGDEMIDEASRKMALMLAAKGAAAGLPGPPRPRSRRPARLSQRLSYATPHDLSVSSRPSVSGSVSSSAGPAHTASSASSPGTSVPPVTAAA